MDNHTFIQQCILNATNIARETQSNKKETSSRRPLETQDDDSTDSLIGYLSALAGSGTSSWPSLTPVSIRE
jgi:hypothetical protein